MKKVISLLLAVLLVFGLCACGEEAPTGTAAGDTEAPEGLQVGFARKNITPDYSVPLSGYGNTSMRMSTDMLDYLYTSVMAISDGENTVLLIENDLGAAVRTVFDQVRDKLNKKTGIPLENIMVAVDHIHSGPDLYNTGEPSIAKYTPVVVDAMVTAGQEAIEDMKPAAISAGETQVQDLNFVRHYILEDGHVRGPSFGLQYNSPKVGHTHEPDRQLQVLSISREGGEEIVLINWQSHPQMATGTNYNSLTSDTVGAMREYVEDQRDCKVFYVLGASGDVQAVSLIDSENVYTDHKSYGKALGDAVLGVLNGQMETLETGPVSVLAKAYTATVDKSEVDKVVDARAIYDQWTRDNDYDAAVAAGEPVGINSPYHANGIIKKSELGDTQTFDIYAFGIGDLGFVFAPYEMFCENGKYIKDNSPFGRTIVCSMANDSYNYISAAEGFDYNCYEANTGRFVKGTGEDLAETYVEMLTELKGQ